MRKKGNKKTCQVSRYCNTNVNRLSALIMSVISLQMQLLCCSVKLTSHTLIHAKKKTFVYITITRQKVELKPTLPH